MPGKRLDSDAPAWQHLRLVEQGGIAGLMRGAEMRAGELDAKLATRVTQLLGKARSTAGQTADYPDGQTLSLEVQTADGPWTAHFDSADLPESMEQLKSLLTFKPVTPPRG